MSCKATPSYLGCPTIFHCTYNILEQDINHLSNEIITDQLMGRYGLYWNSDNLWLQYFTIVTKIGSPRIWRYQAVKNKQWDNFYLRGKIDCEKQSS